MRGERRAVVISGFGVVTANAAGREDFAAALAAGKSGIGEIVSFDPEGTNRERAAEALDFDATPWLRSAKNYLDRNSALAFAACEMALRDAAADLPEDALSAGASLGSAGGNAESLALFHGQLMEKGPRLASPFLFPHSYMNTTAGLLSIEYGLRGPHWCFCSGGCAGLQALGHAADCVALGRGDLMIAGGVEAFSEQLFHAALGRGLLSPTDGGEEMCVPFAECRNGAVLGEGAGLFLLEPLERASARGARIAGRVCGWSQGATAETAMTGALDAAGIDKVDAVFGAAGGSRLEDEEEAAAITELFGVKGVPVTALKGLVGETLGASGPINLAAALAAMERQTLPPVGHDRECAFRRIDLVASPRRAKVKSALVNACSAGASLWASLVVSAG